MTVAVAKRLAGKSLGAVFSYFMGTAVAAAMVTGANPEKLGIPQLARAQTNYMSLCHALPNNLEPGRPQVAFMIRHPQRDII